jgi:hypothetical protein
MRRLFAKLHQQTPRAIALMLCVWLSGAMCILNCNLTNVQAGERVEAESVQENLPSCHRQAPHKSSTKSDDEKSVSIVDAPIFAPINCCPLFNAALEQAKHFQLTKVALKPTQIKLSFPAFQLKREIVFERSYKPPPKHCGHTYLHNCVFLI